MSQSRCTLSVRGLDCPNEVETLRAALEGSPGVRRLGFDLINGLMTVDYARGDSTTPRDLVRLIRERAGMEAALVGRPEATAPASLLVVPERPAGLDAGIRDWRWLLGLLISWLGPRAGMAEATSAEACPGVLRPGGLPRGRMALPSGPAKLEAVSGSTSTSSWGWRSWGRSALGQWDEAATVAFLFGLSETLESLSLERARRAIRRLLEIAPQTAERIEPDGTTRVVPAARSGRETGSWSVPATRSRSTAT